MSNETDELRAQLAALQKRLDALEAKDRPATPFKSDYEYNPNWALDRVGMSPEVMAEFAKAIPREVVCDMISERRRPAPAEAVAQPSAAPKVVNTSGWRDATPLEPPPGINHIDRMLDDADARDRAQLIADEARRKAKAG